MSPGPAPACGGRAAQGRRTRRRAPLLEAPAEDLEEVVGGFGRVLLEFAAERRRELAELEQSGVADPERLAVLCEDVDVAIALAQHAVT